jgi:hypothetical protein
MLPTFTLGPIPAIDSGTQTIFGDDVAPRWRPIAALRQKQGESSTAQPLQARLFNECTDSLDWAALRRQR